MTTPVQQLKRKLLTDNLQMSAPVTEDELIGFEANYSRSLPHDLLEYFQTINGTEGQYDEALICWYPFAAFVPIGKKFKDWGGVPDYRRIVAAMPDRNDLFVFADYLCHSWTYAVQLSEGADGRARIFAIGGDEPVLMADSFSDFVKLYLEDPWRVT